MSSPRLRTILFSKCPNILPQNTKVGSKIILCTMHRYTREKTNFLTFLISCWVGLASVSEMGRMGVGAVTAGKWTSHAPNCCRPSFNGKMNEIKESSAENQKVLKCNSWCPFILIINCASSSIMNLFCRQIISRQISMFKYLFCYILQVSAFNPPYRQIALYSPG